MLGINELKRAWSIITHPGSVSDTIGVEQALVFYYKAALVPLIIGTIIATALGLLVGTLANSLTGVTSASSVMARYDVMTTAIGTVLLYVLIVLPLGFLVDAAIYHLFAKSLFHIWSKPFNNTMTAVLYGTLPILLFIWLTFIPVVGEVLLAALSIWGFIVLIISMARQQGVSGWRAFGGILLGAVIFVVIVFVVVSALFSFGVFSKSSSLLGPSCIPLQGFICTSPSYSGGHITVTLGQETGINWTSAEFAYVPTSASPGAATYVAVQGGMKSGATDTVTLPVSVTPGSAVIYGSIYANYKLTTSQLTPNTTEIAEIVVPLSS